jgi:hypothetical protein
MSPLRRWAPIALGVLLVAMAAVGYAQLAPGIANPRANLRATVRQPPAGETLAAFLDDGRPVFVAHDESGALAVLDAQSSHVPSGVGQLLAWCSVDRHFEDRFGGSTFAPSGARIDGPAPSGLRAYGLQSLPERTDLIGVTSATFAVDRPGPPGPATGAGCSGPWLVHEPDPDDIFDPSVAVDQEPSDWIWLDGRMAQVGDQVVLCDASAADCATFAALPGIAPAYLNAVPGPGQGRWIGRVRDGAIEGVIRVPTLEEVQ